MINLPPIFGPTSCPFSSTIIGSTPKKGSVALPGLVGIAPERGVIRIDPVSIRQRAVNDVTMARDPANIGCTPKNVFIADVEDVFHGRVNADEITASRM